MALQQAVARSGGLLALAVGALLLVGGVVVLGVSVAFPVSPEPLILAVLLGAGAALSAGGYVARKRTPA